MSEYDFANLSPFEFESICRDLLSARYGIPFQAFTTGRDGGIDLRYSNGGDKTIIGQCKHFARSGYAKLLSHLKQKELPKIRAMSPGHYVLATSLGLTPDNVDELFGLLTPYVRTPADILGKDDLNAILRDKPTIEVSHPKLWLAKAPVLQRILQNGVFAQSALTEAQIRRRLSLFVQTKAFDEASQFLKAKRVCILAGVPGVGKTTIAEMLVVEYLERGYQLVSVQQNASEAMSLFSPDPDCRQLFLYDDFLGQIAAGDKLNKNEDKVLIQLIEAVQKHPHKRFVLTTREYILKDAISGHEHLSRARLEILFKYVVRCEDYTEFEKAHILANHLYFSDVPIEHIFALCDGHAYRRIIRHPHYSPRIVEWMTQSSETGALIAEEYPKVFEARLDNPSELWSHAYDRQIRIESRQLLLVLATFGDGIQVDDLGEAFQAFFLARASKYGFAGHPRSYLDALNECEGNFLQIGLTNLGKVVSFHNPSIREFVNRRVASSVSDAIDLVQSAVFFEQIEGVERILSLYGDDGIPAMTITMLDDCISNAILKTIDHRSVGLSSTRHGKRELWSRRGTSRWSKLRSCIRLLPTISGPKLHACIESLLTETMGSVPLPYVTVADLTEIATSAALISGFADSAKQEWSNIVTQEITARKDLEDDGWESLVAASNWLHVAGYELTTDSRLSYESNLGDAIRRETQRTEWSDSDQVGTTLGSLEEIESILGWKYDAEKEECQKALQEHPPAPEETPDDWELPAASPSDNSIDELFSSLFPSLEE